MAAEPVAPNPVLAASNLCKWYPVYRSFLPTWLQARPLRHVKAVDGVSFAVTAGEVLGLAGESGSGKSTTAELLIALQRPTAGAVLYRGQPVRGLSGAGLKAFRRQVQMVVQDPYQSLNPHFTVRRLVEEPLLIHNLGQPAERAERVRQALHDVGLRPVDRYWQRLPHELSGGERQRVAVARALVLRPEVLILDEPTSMLDVSLRAGLLNLLQRLAEQYRLTMLIISHDVAVLRYMCHRIAIMYLGKIAEIGAADLVVGQPLHPYTQALLAAVPNPDPRQRRARSSLPSDLEASAGDLPGCPFAPRCRVRLPECATAAPALLSRERREVACFR